MTKQVIKIIKTEIRILDDNSADLVMLDSKGNEYRLKDRIITGIEVSSKSKKK